MIDIYFNFQLIYKLIITLITVVNIIFTVNYRNIYSGLSYYLFYYIAKLTQNSASLNFCEKTLYQTTVIFGFTCMVCL